MLTAVVVASAAVPKKAEGDALIASWYGTGLEGNLTASGDPLAPHTEYTAASRTLPFGTEIGVCYESCTSVEVTDRGPAEWTGADIDLSAVAADEIGLIPAGKDAVEITYIDYSEAW